MQASHIKIGIVVLLIAVGVGYFATKDNGSKAATAKDATTVVSEKSTADTVTTELEKTPSATDTQIAEVGTYQAYDPELVTNSNAEHIVLFFHATWCPSCRALEKDILANKGAIPAGVEIYKVDYDTAIALKKQYGVTTQHSLIEIASDGTAKSSITHPATLADVLKTI
jgi:thioredoxin 1